MIRGKVIKVKENKVIVMTDKFEFLQVEKQDSVSPGEEIVISENNTIKDFSRISQVEDFSRISHVKNFSRVTGARNFSRVINIKNFSRVSGLAAAITMIFMVTQFYLFSKKTVDNEFAYIDVDINPSVEFTIDSSGIVSDASPINEDANLVLDKIEPKKRHIKEASDKLIKESDKAGFMSNRNGRVVLFSAALNKNSEEYKRDKKAAEKKLKELLEMLMNLAKGDEYYNDDERSIEIKVVTVQPEVRKESIKRNMSMGRYIVYVKAKEQGIEMPLDEAKSITIGKALKEVKIVYIDSEDEIGGIFYTVTPTVTPGYLNNRVPTPEVSPGSREETYRPQVTTTNKVDQTHTKVPLSTTHYFPTISGTHKFTPKPANMVTGVPTPTKLPVSNTTIKPTNTAVPVETHSPTEGESPTPTAKVWSTPMTTTIPTSTIPVPPTATAIPASTVTSPPAATVMVTSTNTPTQTGTATPVSTETPIQTGTATPASTETPTQTGTATPASTATPTQTGTATPASTATPTPTYTATPVLTATPTPTYTATPTSTETPTPTYTVTPTSTETPTPTYTVTPTSTETPTPTYTVTPTSTETPTPTDTVTPTSTETPTPTYTVTPTSTETPTPTDTVTPTSTETPTPTYTVTPTSTETPTPTYTYTVTPTSTETPTPTYTVTPTSTETPTPTYTVTPTSTETPTPTDTVTPTSTETPTPTDTVTPTSTETPTPTYTVTPTSTETPTPTYTVTPTSTETPTPTNTVTPTSTETPTPTNTATPTSTETPTPTDTATPTSTETPTSTNTATPTSTETPTPTDTATPTSTETPTPTDTVTPTSTETPTSTNTATPTSTETPTPTDTATPTSTETPTPTDTATPTSTETPTPTYTATPTSTETPTPTDTVTPTSTETPTPTDTATPTSTETPTPTDTVTPTSTETPTSTNTVTPTSTETPTPTDTVTPTSTETPTPTYTVTPTSTETPTPTYTVTPTSTETPTPTYTVTPTSTETPTPTYTVTPTSTETPTPTDTVTPTSTETPTPTYTVTPTSTETPTPTNTVTPTSTETPTPTNTATPTSTETPTPTNTATPTSTNTPTSTSTSTPTSTVDSIKIQGYNFILGDGGNQVGFKIKIINTGSNVLNLSDIKAKYYFTNDGTTPTWNTYIDSCSASGVTVSRTFVDITGGTNADKCLEISFDSGTLAALEEVTLQLRMSKTDWTGFNQTDDYSYDPLSVENVFTDWNRVAGFIKGNLVWGTPADNYVTATPTQTPTPMPTNTVTPTGAGTPVPATESIKIQGYSNLVVDTTDMLSPNMNIINTGSTTIDVSKIKVRYYFTNEATLPLTYTIDYCSFSVTGTFIDITGGTYADKCIEFSFSGGALAPGGVLTLSARIKDQEKTMCFDQTNDYSYITSNKTHVYTDWDSVTGYINGTLVWGIPADGYTASTNTPTPTPTPAPASGIKIMGCNTTLGDGVTQFGFYIKIINTGSSALNLSSIKVRYYFTNDGTPTWNTFIDSCSASGVTVGRTFIDITGGTNANKCLELSFDSGTLAANGEVTVQLRMRKTDNSPFNQTDDYSYDPTNVSPVDWNRMTGYINGSLVWGIPADGYAASTNAPTPTPTATPTSTAVTTPTPTPASASDSIKIQGFNTTLGDGIVQLGLYIKIINTGSSALNLSSIKVRYYFTNDGTPTWNTYIDSFSASGVTVGRTFIDITGGTNANKCLELSFDSGTLAANGEVTVQLRMRKTDNSPFNQTDDYSYDPINVSPVDWNRVTGYINGSLAWGIPADG